MNPDWLVGNPSRRSLWSALWLGSSGLLILGLQPILLGALLTEGRVNFDQLALAATAEMLAIGIGSVLAAFVLGSGAIRLKAALFLAAVTVFDHLTATAQSPNAIILFRGLAGLAQGCLVAFAVELIARSRHPGRLGGYFVSLQTFAQSVIAALLAIWIVARWGSFGGFEALALISLASAVVIFTLPDAYESLPKPSGGSSSGLLRMAPITALFTIFFYYMFLGALWAFLEPLGADAGIDATTVGLMVSFSLIAQLIGAFAATFLEVRLPFRPVLLTAALLAVLVALGIASRPAAPLFWSLAMLTGLLWLSVVPFQIRIAVDADEARRAALLVPAAQLFGAALGPAGASFFVETGSSTAVAYFAAVCAALSGVAVALNAAARPGQAEH